MEIGSSPKLYDGKKAEGRGGNRRRMRGRRLGCSRPNARRRARALAQTRVGLLPRFSPKLRRDKISGPGLNWLVERRLRSDKPSARPADWKGIGLGNLGTRLQGFWYGLGLPGCSIVSGSVVLFTQSTDKVTRCWLGRIGIAERFRGKRDHGSRRGKSGLGNGGKFYVD